MDIFLIALACLAAFHFLYQDVVLPSIQVSLKNKFFRLRDDLRMLKILGDPAADEDAYPIIQEGINNFINSLPSLHLVFTQSFVRSANAIPSCEHASKGAWLSLRTFRARS